MALMILTKAYFLPVALSYFFILPLSLRSFKKPLVQFLLGGAVIGSIILLPTLLTSFSEFYRDIVEYSLIRPQGISKTAIFTALLQREFLFVLLWGISIFLIKKYRFYGALSVISALFFLFYKDFYFYYFNLLAPFLCIFAGIFINHVENKYRLQKAIIPTLLFLCICINMIQYFSTSRSHVLTNYQEIISVAKTQNQPVIYGTNDIAPLLAYETKKPLLQGVVDTNPTLFVREYLTRHNSQKLPLSKKHCLLDTVFITQNIIFDKTLMMKFSI